MPTRDPWSSDTAQPLGDARLQLTAIPSHPYALLTSRGKDHEVSVSQLLDLSLRALQAAARLEGSVRGMAVDAAEEALTELAGQTVAVCPSCDGEVFDFDGFGVLAHEDCGWCSHPAIDDGQCGICDAVIDTDPS